MRDCPCINCITFSICKIQVREYMKDYAQYHVISNNYGYVIYLNVLRSKCSLIREWRDITNIPEHFNVIYELYK